MSTNDYLKLFVAIFVSELAGIIGSFFTISEIPNWYAGLAKPALTPPDFVFGPVWITLYALMGIAAFLIWKNGLGERRVRIARAVFILQLVLNALWSVVFFDLQSPGSALVVIALLWLFIFWTMVLFRKISKWAAYLLVPYILWVSFAMYLNYAIWILN